MVVVGSDEMELVEVLDDDQRSVLWQVDHVAFGSAFDRAGLERELPVLRGDDAWIVSVDGVAAGVGANRPLRMAVPGGALVPVAGVTAIGVLPSHRRRGVLSTLMPHLLERGSQRGAVASVLYASEAQIYGRWGFGPATRSQRVLVDCGRAAFRPDVAVAGGRIRVVLPHERADVLPELWARAAHRRGGEMLRSDEMWAAHLTATSEDGKEHLCLVHELPDGTPVGYVLYRVAQQWDTTGPSHTAEVSELVAVDAPAELALLRALVDLDLVSAVDLWVTPDTVLLAALADRWAVRTKGEIDSIWVRLLDVPGALGARSYRVPGRLVLDVVDERSPAVSGRWLLEVAGDGTALVERTGDDADLRLGVAELGSQWLGRATMATLAMAGRVEERTPGAAARADAVLGWTPEPRTTLSF